MSYVHEGRQGGECHRQVIPGDGQTGMETGGVQEEHHRRHAKARTPHRHAEHAVRPAAVARTVAHHGDHRAAQGQLGEAGSAKRGEDRRLVEFIQTNNWTSHHNGGQHNSDSSDSQWKKTNRKNIAKHTFATDVCKKQGFNPDDHGLKFQRNVLDLSLQWRFASVPNNAKLEVVPSTRKQTGTDSQVRIALQMEDGSRLQGSFSSGQTLWELLTHFPQTRASELSESGSTPVCVYMRDEVSGEDALKKATLKSLGLTGGSAIVRFLLKKTKSPGNGDDDGMETASTATDPIAKETKPRPLPPFEPPLSQPERAELPSIKKESPDRPVETADAPVPSAAGMVGGPPKAKKSKPDNAKRQASDKQDDWAVVEEFLEPVDREPLIYHMDSGARRYGNEQDLPDEFFEVTVDDIRKRFAQLKSERRVLEEAPLMTKALRESQMKDKMDRYPRVVLRVQFPDRRVLQGFFRPLETVIAPPKTILEDPTATLFQANLFPAALVYLGSEVKTESYLQRDLLDSSVSSLQADQAIAGCMPRSSPPSSSSSSMVTEEPLPDPPAGTREVEEEEEPNTHGQAPKPVRTDPGKVPKWLKLPGKK
ncbi:unnamed protein product [Coregonus sp. 'balchen']|nr:unnamed protein product [Coregonus sp. 'balchen']